jgi:predicted PurR-regulated permease PerM
MTFPQDALPGPVSPSDGRRTALTIIAGCAFIVLLKYMQDVLVPLVLSGLIFYALDPLVDLLQRWRVPRAIGAGVVLAAVVAGVGAGAYQMSDDVIVIVEQMPSAARRLRAALRPGPGGVNGVLGRVQQAATELDKTAAEVTTAPAPRGVVKVQVEEPGLRASDLVWSGSLGMAKAGGQTLMVLLLAYFLLLANDLFKRKLVVHLGDTLSKKKITVQAIDQISERIGRFLIVQIFTSAVVAIATGLALWALGVERAAFWGLAAGLLNSIPYFGPLIVTAGLSVISFIQFGTITMMATVAATALLITTLEGWLLTPTLLGRAAQMNQVAVFSGLLFWSWLWGVWGMLLAVPMMMIIKTTCEHIEDLHPVADLLGE